MMYSYKDLNKLRKNKGSYCRCAICNERFYSGETRTIDHIIPLAVAKWGGVEDLEKSLEELNSSENMVVVHDECNKRKCAYVSTHIEDYDGISYNSDKFKELFNKYYEAIKKYIKTINIVSNTQKYKCAFCGRPLEINKRTLTRKDSSKERSIDNAMILCCKCRINHYVMRKSEVS